MGRDFKNIKAWQFANELVLEIYKITRKFPKDEQYGLISQIRRAAVSVPTNIVEGSGRRTSKDYLNFLYIAKSSLLEVEYLLLLSSNLGYMLADEYKRIEDLRIESIKILQGLIKAVE